jgi:transcriptional regulator GlxA family with amidase domain
VFRDAFPRVGVSEQIFVIDRDIVTAAWGVVALDQTVALIARAWSAPGAGGDEHIRA